LQTLNISSNVLINLRAPRREFFAVLDEGIDSLSAQVTDEIDGALKTVAMVFHEDDDHVVRVATGLFDVI